jgi:hypothetical protein
LAGTVGGAYLGGFGGGAGLAAGTAFGKCWIARAIYGETSNEWVLARHWIFDKWSGKIANIVQSLYVKYGEGFAEIVKGNNTLKAILKPLFDVAVTNGAKSILGRT